MENKENIYARGIWFNEKKPEFIIGGLSISKETFMKWLEEQEPNKEGYIKLDIKKSQKGTHYFQRDFWEKDQVVENAVEEKTEEDETPF